MELWLQSGLGTRFLGPVPPRDSGGRSTLDASVFDYDDATVTLLSDTAAAYVKMRTTQERIRLLDVVIHVQEDVLRFIEERLKLGKGATEIDRARPAVIWSRAAHSVTNLCSTCERPKTSFAFCWACRRSI